MLWLLVSIFLVCFLFPFVCFRYDFLPVLTSLYVFCSYLHTTAMFLVPISNMGHCLSGEVCGPSINVLIKIEKNGAENVLILYLPRTTAAVRTSLISKFRLVGHKVVVVVVSPSNRKIGWISWKGSAIGPHHRQKRRDYKGSTIWSCWKIFALVQLDS